MALDDDQPAHGPEGPRKRPGQFDPARPVERVEECRTRVHDGDIEGAVLDRQRRQRADPDVLHQHAGVGGGRGDAGGGGLGADDHDRPSRQSDLRGQLRGQRRVVAHHQEPFTHPHARRGERERIAPGAAAVEEEVPEI